MLHFYSVFCKCGLIVLKRAVVKIFLDYIFLCTRVKFYLISRDGPQNETDFCKVGVTRKGIIYDCLSIGILCLLRVAIDYQIYVISNERDDENEMRVQ